MSEPRKYFFTLINEPRDFFAYIVKKPDGTPFYVGESSAFSHSAFGIGNRYKIAILRHPAAKKIAEEIWQSGESVLVEFNCFESRELSMNEEIRLINEYGRLDLGTGILVNNRDGGGLGNYSKETRSKLGNPGLSKNKGNKRPDLAAYNQNHPRHGRPISDEEYLKRYGQNRS
jgi:hypothetical protein